MDGDTEKLTEIIRFGLSQLGAQNQHHDFEHIARHIARNRIASNILPATGPVAGRGDQGRDAETFRTYLAKTPLKGSAFAGLAVDGPIAFACTIQQSKLTQKIQQDVQKITGSGIPVESIHYFTVANIPSGDRHKLQSWARDEFGVHLDIHDGRYIAEALTEPDLFWIASEYLSVPREMYPEARQASGSSWYQDTLATWSSVPDRLATIAHFEEIKQAIRHATFTPELRVHLPFWLDRLRIFMAGDHWDDLHRRAAYETLVALLHQKGTLEGLEPLIRRYFDADYSSMSIDDLHDAAILVTFCAGAIPVSAVGLTLDEIGTWRFEIVAEVERRSVQVPPLSDPCHLLFIQGFLELMNIDGSPEANSHAAIEKWKELPETIRRSPLFPLEPLIDELIRLTRSKYFRRVSEDPGFNDVVHKLDDALAVRMGAKALAQKSHRRARAHHDNDRLLMAVTELRRARRAAYSYESLETWLESLLYTAELLIDLGLPYAAKYYAMAATWISGRCGKSEAESYQADAMLIAARADLFLGNWACALGLISSSAQAWLHYVSSRTWKPVSQLLIKLEPICSLYFPWPKRLTQHSLRKSNRH